MMQFHPHSMELRCSLGLLAYQVSLAQSRCIHLATDSSEMALAAVRQLGRRDYTLRVDSRHIQRVLMERLGLAAELDQNFDAPAAVGAYPYTSIARVSQARKNTIAIACENAISYKSLIYPGRAHNSLYAHLKALKHTYSLNAVASLFSPGFISCWSLAKCVERFNSSLYFQLEDRAMRRLISFGPMWRFSYLVILAGQRIG